MTTSFRRLKRFIKHSMSLGANFIRTVHVSNKLDIAIVMLTIGGECVTNPKCPQLIHTCSERDEGFCLVGKLHDC